MKGISYIPFVKIDIIDVQNINHYLDVVLKASIVSEGLSSERDIIKVKKRAKIRNRYNQVPHLTQDSNGKVTNSDMDQDTFGKVSKHNTHNSQ